jgi:hypothetical protein
VSIEVKQSLLSADAGESKVYGINPQKLAILNGLAAKLARDG